MSQSIFLFYGENHYASHQKLQFWKKEFVKKYGEESVEVYDGKKIDIQEIATNIESLPFFSDKRMIIIKDFLSKNKAEKQKLLAENLDKTHENCFLVFHETESPDKRSSLYKKIKKIGKVEEFPAATAQEISKWILDRAKKDNLKINFSVANYMSQHCKPDLWTIANEMEKLKLFSEGKEISTEIVDQVCTPSLSSSIFKLTDSLAARRAKDSLNTFNILNESGEDLLKILFMLVRHFRILIQVKDLQEKGENPGIITKKMKQHPFVIKKSSEQTKNFEAIQLQKIYANLLDIEVKSKSGVIKISSNDNREFALAIEHFIIDCCAGK